MFLFIKYLIQKLRLLAQLHHTQQISAQKASQTSDEQPKGNTSKELTGQLKKDADQLHSLLGQSNDIKTHSVHFGPDNVFSGMLFYVDGLADNLTLTQAIMFPIMQWNAPGARGFGEKELLKELQDAVLCSADITTAQSFQDLANGCFWGDTVLLVEGCASGLIINSKGWEKRSITEPQSETVVRGPREGFTENLRTNTSLIRRKIRNGQLRAEQLSIGEKTQTGVCIMFLEGVANPKVVRKVRSRIKAIQVDSILESGYIEQYIEDAPFSPFSTIAYSEKPDVVAAQILEGRVAILVDGTPFVLTAPMLFVENFQSAEDYYSRPMYASLIRLIRFLGYLLTVFAPAIYIALTAFHQELIPITLLFRIEKAHEGTPFPVFMEALIMVFAFEILREAGVRLPRPVGQAISIVGALIMGDAAVNAGIVGAPMVITIAVTAVSSFLVPTLNDSSSMLRIIMMILAATIGFYGVALGFLAMLIHLASLESFGVPYFDSLSHAVDMQDALIRMPLQSMVKRPVYLAKGDRNRRRRFVFPSLRPYANEDEGKEQSDASNQTQQSARKGDS